MRQFILDNRLKYPSFFNGPVPSFGDADAELLIIGLAPGLKGANATGRPFTGDYAGDLLYETLAEFDLSNGMYEGSANDGLALKRAMITNAVRCVPPQNKPIGEEINTCRDYLISQMKALPHLKALLCLGKISHDSTIRSLGLKLKDHPFAHNVAYDLEGGVTLFSSYHCSRYNTNTKRLTEKMFHDVFRAIKSHIDE
ncbi:uracil-DNA glycosylase [Litorimonas taeanensis]|uniref:uracil-DNA glycosylase n=1 Tax=Litorimonas taeanensis TaxID=568099 RepID=UPI001F373E8D|nr:uracil-DNA glycosylase [Litorimonas taeanensis]